MQQTLDRIRRAESRESGKGTAVGKPRFDSLVIISESTLRQKIEYTHTNPVRKRLVREPWHWHYSSAAAYAGPDGARRCREETAGGITHRTAELWGTGG